ncbi:hypothetical protein NLG97_g2257 [Lecanicillium saksenae]|uniref:Uncharacterized protein n=1 Tax=Lecanicillium saksenae TaxID=468837 RepID=A0ACC1R5H0_9HYPO|nr:hypothetical protein NLG97_g2257 [Lecanicillium saksenae]
MHLTEVTARGSLFTMAFLFGTATADCRAPGVQRIDLQNHTTSIPGYRAIQNRVDFKQGASFPRHVHPADEIVYAVGGVLQYIFDDKPSVTLTTGEVLFIPAGTAHSVQNIGYGMASELGTYIAPEGEQLLNCY